MREDSFTTTLADIFTTSPILIGLEGNFEVFPTTKLENKRFWLRIL